MEELDAACLEAFPSWLRNLNADARVLAQLVEEERGAEDARRHLAGALNYLFKSLDLIPDGIEDLGFIDDAFVFRAAAALAVDADATLAAGDLERLAKDDALMKDFLGQDYDRLQGYVRGLDQVNARGRTAHDVLGDPGARADLAREVRAWADAYEAPSFNRDVKTLVKLKAFLTAKLP
ncbi:MAG: YkvA family protein [Polyangiaceae bacterium]